MTERAAEEAQLPLVRVWMLGPFEVELRQADGSWQALPGGIWRTYFYARPLLQRLLCAHGRRLERQQLQMDLWPREEPSEAMERYPLTAAGQVRKLLGKRELLRTCGQGYQLADQRWIWTDVDEALWWLGEARRRGLETLEALPVLQEAERLFRRGRLLEEQAAVWAVAYREWVGGERWRAGLALARLYEREGLLSEAGEQYRQMYEEHPYREEALIEVYGWWLRQGERERAERVLRAGCQRLEQEGVPLSEEAQERVRRLRERQESGLLVRVQGEAVVYWEGSKGALREEMREERGRRVLPLALPEPEVKWLPAGSGEERMGGEGEQGECGVSVLLWPLTWGRQGRESLREMERLMQEELSMSESKGEAAEGRAAKEQRLPRRTALLVLAGMPQVLLGLGSVGGGGGWEWEGVKEGRLREEVLPVVAGSITASWHLLNEGEFETVERTIGGLLPWLRRWAYEPSGVQQEAAYLAAQGHLLLGFVAYHRLQFQQDLSYDQEGVALSRVSGVPTLLVKALTCLGLDYYHLGAPLQMQRALEEANRLLGYVPPVLHWAVYTGLALAYAKQGRAEEAVECLSQAREWGGTSRLGEDQLPVYLQADEGPWKLIVRESLVHLELSRHGEEKKHAQEAERALAQIERWSGLRAVPERIRLEIVNREGGGGDREGRAGGVCELHGAGSRRSEEVGEWQEEAGAGEQLEEGVGAVARGEAGEGAGGAAAVDVEAERGRRARRGRRRGTMKEGEREGRRDASASRFLATGCRTSPDPPIALRYLINNNTHLFHRIPQFAPCRLREQTNQALLLLLTAAFHDGHFENKHCLLLSALQPYTQG
ncbi:AfsR/SARP family transcriptional regulator [Thermogemmatispora tikiterensis]|uniref:Uncharacterized protein n=1 Tax=Thermogemmatispora tikiterensis TaxID=1825093 RepID=A0A328VRT7_9CHLR|nr:hypothetical protein [Thermogemmatispora tikiterensis]RAQ98423.1 hypothetical protein A4R35_22975 [Thermogemmatispora tikiterensis]